MTALKNGDTVRVIMTTSEMNALNLYGGNHDLGDIITIAEVVGHAGRTIFKASGEVYGVAPWMRDDFVELVAEDLPKSPVAWEDMPREERAEIMLASYEGARVQISSDLDTWVYIPHPSFNCPEAAYRVEPAEVKEIQEKIERINYKMNSLNEEKRELTAPF
jgi:hypothetical protein